VIAAVPRPDQTDEKREKLTPIVAQAFAELGYRRATTAELARRCKVRENILYRLWPDKKAMFIASIDFVYEQAAATWKTLLDRADDAADTAVSLLAYEAEHYGETGLQRIVFAGLSETREPEIREALRKMYERFHRFIRGQVAAHRGTGRTEVHPDETVTAWAIVGLGNLANMSRELELMSDRTRKRMFAAAGRLLLDGKAKRT